MFFIIAHGYIKTWSLSMDVSRHCTRRFLVILHGCLSLLSTDVSHTVPGCLTIVHGCLSYCPWMSLVIVHGCFSSFSTDVSHYYPRMSLILSMDVSSLYTEVSRHSPWMSLDIVHVCLSLVSMDVSRYYPWMSLVIVHGCFSNCAWKFRHCPRMSLILSTDVSHIVNGRLSRCSWMSLVTVGGDSQRAIRSHTQLKISVVRIGVQ